jgi:mono/diheme cytochrome c family protein
MRSPFAALFFLSLSVLSAEDFPVKTPPLPTLASKQEQGLVLQLQSGGKIDTRPARLVSIALPAGAAPSPFLPPGPVQLKWEGHLYSELRAECILRAEVRGDFQFKINGVPVLKSTGNAQAQPVSEPVALKKGLNEITVELSGDGKSDLSLQLQWASKEFPFEPIPPTAFRHDISHPALREGARLREGRLLFAQLRCTACHADPTFTPPRGQGMPELAQDAPVFDEIGSKFNEPWLAHWINEPHGIRPQSLMPKVFHGAKPGEMDPRAADLAAYFVANAKRAESEPLPDVGPQGGALFANLGCIACHTAPEFEGDDEHKRTPLSHLKAKWHPPALRDYLKNPTKNYAWTRMPHSRLTDEEATQLAAFLLSGNQQDFSLPVKGNPERGAQHLATSGCLNCHAGMPPTTQPPLAATLKAGWTKGCLAPDSATRGAAPDFNLTPEQRSALLAFGASGLGSLHQDSPIEFAHRQSQQLRCAACHSRDGAPSTWSALEGEMLALQSAAPAPTEGEEAPAAGSVAPLLTWTGEKLQPQWMRQFIAGQISYKPRPWLIARMPGFGACAEGLAEGLSLDHGLLLKQEPEPPVDVKKASDGEKLLGENGGFNCTGCHGVGAKPATAVFEAPGINLAYANERLRKAFYHRWLLSPLRVEPETKMPRFADESGKTPLTEFYDGNARDQFEAIWEYLRTQKATP